jgi:hypothetical protein
MVPQRRADRAVRGRLAARRRRLIHRPDTPTVTRDVDIMPEGHRLVNGVPGLRRVAKAR